MVPVGNKATPFVGQPYHRNNYHHHHHHHHHHHQQVQELWKCFFVMLLAPQIGQKNAVQNLFTDFQQLFNIMTKIDKNYLHKDKLPGSAA